MCRRTLRSMVTQPSRGDPVPPVTSIASLTNAHPWTRPVLNKVPGVSLRFWILTLVATALGATAADSLSADLDLGLTATSAVMSLLLVSALIAQLSTRRFHPGSYWLSIVLCACVGTLFADTLVGDFGSSLWVVTGMSCAALAATFVGWHHLEHTVSFHSLRSRRREACYWTAVFSLGLFGSSVEDLVPLTLNVGLAAVVLLFTSGLVAVAAAGAGHRIPVVVAFWTAYVVTLPLGDAIADLLTAAPPRGGLGLGKNATSAGLAVLFLVVVSLAATIRHRRDPEQSGAGQV